MLALLLISSVYAGKKHSGPEVVAVDAEEEERLYLEEWQEHMRTFSPSDVVTFELIGKGKTEFYEEISVIPSILKGAWFSTDEQAKDLDFQLLDPSGEVVFERKLKHEGIFTYEAKRRGNYRFTFASHKYLKPQYVTFAIHLGNSTEQVLQVEHLSPIETVLQTATRTIKDLQMDSQFAQVRQDSHFQTIAEANSHLFWLSVVECLCIIGVTAWQVIYVKKLLDHRRVI
mmetsp:Transcript_13528/g.25471  ORF Transcript_13528/g.25471 Transcript_13528/m.25471 type:complete len:229 (+) Transcript_13528:678-1364(+)|eukprot:CAMPEP_0204901110 /NCGR_PEP_ID=MMETSP1397-20131031/2882_1 /ASSEMBLY_ACC=CAM_ASM_000891 /TAXON_ID=49980 /ORGANISM="Climacostomum Climacostomum virens, Strain Stock W-24" /LENGTH=228 /DNA_ID=CAMNT_0052069403 /DNA_START=583 /DNA_END=1269 /DNA_ORIENTATION=+